MEFGAVCESENLNVFVTFCAQVVRFLLDHYREVVFEVVHYFGRVEEKSKHSLIFVHWYTFIGATLFYHPLHLESLFFIQLN